MHRTIRRDALRDGSELGSRPSALFAVLSAMIEGPPRGREFAEPRQGPACLDLDEDVLDIVLRIDAQQQAVVDEGVRDRETFAAAHGTGEEKVSAADGERPDSALDAAVVNLETAVFEAASQVDVLTQRVGRRRPQRRLRQELGIDLRDPAIQRVEDRQRALAAHLGPGCGVEAAVLALGFDSIELPDVLDGIAARLSFASNAA